jgi:DNA-binding Lrp family transcriptional regulator
MKRNRRKNIPLLDELDKSIIEELQKDARQSYYSLGLKLQVSEGTIRNRIDSELKKEVMTLQAVIKPLKIGLNFTCVMGLEIAVDKLRIAGTELAKCPNVYFLVGCTGDFDFLAFLVFKDATGFEQFMTDVISVIPGIKKCRTFVSTSLVKTPWNDTVAIRQLLD